MVGYVNILLSKISLPILHHIAIILCHIGEILRHITAISAAKELQ